MGTKSKKTILPDYLKKSLKGTTIGGSLGVDDNEYVTIPKGSLSLKKGKTTVEGGISKPYSKFDKQNINSEISLSLSKEFDNESGGLSLTGTKSGKQKSAVFSISKSFKCGGEARGTGAAIKGKGFKGVF